MMVAEDIIARELADILSARIGYGTRERFNEEVEIDSNTIVFVDGVVNYSISYEEATNYYRNVDVSVDIDCISVYDSEGNEQKVKFNQSAIERFMAQYIED